jgi:putative membrane protein
MAHASTDTAPNIWVAAAAGLIAGLAASLAMDLFQAGVAALSSSDSDAEPATQKAADKVSQAVLGHDIPEQRKPLAGQVVHYALGAGLGVAYAVAAEYRPAVTAGYGTAFAVVTTTLLDETAVPAVGLGDAPWKTSPTTHLYGAASHVVFGTVTEAVRRLLRGWMK